MEHYTRQMNRGNLYNPTWAFLVIVGIIGVACDIVLTWRNFGDYGRRLLPGLYAHLESILTPRFVALYDGTRFRDVDTDEVLVGCFRIIL